MRNHFENCMSTQKGSVVSVCLVDIFRKLLHGDSNDSIKERLMKSLIKDAGALTSLTYKLKEMNNLLIKFINHLQSLIFSYLPCWSFIGFLISPTRCAPTSIHLLQLQAPEYPR